MLDTQEERCSRLSSLLRELHDLLEEDFRTLVDAKSLNTGTPQWQELTKQYNETWSQITKPAETGVGEDEDYTNENESKAAKLAHDRQELSKLVEISVSRFTCLLAMRRSVETSGVPATTLPLRLKRWMVQEAGDEKTMLGGNGESCHGGGSRRRIACILATLLYKWLEDRCKEWHSELTQKEILDSMNDIVVLNDADSNDIALKPSKPSKKKKKRKAVSQAETDTVIVKPCSTKGGEHFVDHEQNEVIPDDGESGEKMAVADRSPMDQARSLAGLTNGMKPTQVKDGSVELGEWATVGNKEVDLSARRSADSPETSASETVATLAGDSTSDKDGSVAESQNLMPTRVGVMSPTGFQSAEDYLIGRLNALLKKNGNSSPQIVVL
jgi:hypothetical protein